MDDYGYMYIIDLLICELVLNVQIQLGTAPAAQLIVEIKEIKFYLSF